MFKPAVLTIWLGLSTVAMAQTLDNVQFQMSSKQWVTTESALLKVRISATLTDTDIVKARTQLLEGLAQIAPLQWQLIQFNRSQDESGLAKLDVMAQVRVNLNGLDSVYQKASQVSHPGLNFSIQSVDFKPSPKELQAAKTQLRAKLYQDVQQEVWRLNQAFPTQQCSLHQLQFIDDTDVPVMPQAKTDAVMLNTAPQTMSVSNEISLTVLVDVASTRGGGQK